VNRNTVSAECWHHWCSHCDFESCACICHLRDLLDREEQHEVEPEPDPDDRGYPARDRYLETLP
jgi:hypothetical protein